MRFKGALHINHIHSQSWYVYLYSKRIFPGGSDGKASACNVEDPGLIPGWGRSLGEGKGNPLYYFLQGEFHRQMSLAGYSPWGHKELDTTEQLTLSLFQSKHQVYTY